MANDRDEKGSFSKVKPYLCKIYEAGIEPNHHIEDYSWPINTEIILHYEPD